GQGLRAFAGSRAQRGSGARSRPGEGSQPDRSELVEVELSGLRAVVGLPGGGADKTHFLIGRAGIRGRGATPEGFPESYSSLLPRYSLFLKHVLRYPLLGKRLIHRGSFCT